MALWGMSPGRIITITRFQYSYLTLAAAAGTGIFLSGSPFQAINFTTDFGSLFELYRPLRTEISWVPAVNVNDFVNATPLDLQPMFVGFTPTKTTAPASVNDLLEMQTMRSFPLFKPWKYGFTPSVAYSLSTGNAFPPGPSTWLSIGSNPQMNGLRVWVDNCGNAATSTVGSFVYKFTFQLSFPT